MICGLPSTALWVSSAVLFQWHLHIFLKLFTQCQEIALCIYTSLGNAMTFLNNVWTYHCDAIVLSMATLYSLGHNNQNEVKQDFFSHIMPLAPALLSCDANCITNGTIFFIRYRKLKKG